jgi:hypothetical protein
MTFKTLVRGWPIAAVVALLVAAVLAAAHSTPQLDRLPEGGTAAREAPTLTPEPTPPTVTPLEEEPADAIRLPEWIPYVISAVVVALAAVVLIVFLWVLISVLFRRRDRASEPPEPERRARAAPEEAAAVLAAVDAGLDDLSDLDQDPRRAVIACWLRLEEAAAAAGVPRRVGDTSTDLVVRLLGGDDESGRRLSADVLAGFAEVYREARFATRPVDARTREQARDALRRLRAELAPAATG